MEYLILQCGYPFSALLIFCIATSCQNKALIWRIDNTTEIGGYSPIIIGEPRLESEPSFSSFSFNGENEGIILPLNPIDGFKEFTVEVLFNPSFDGHAEQRFVHFQDKKGNRGLLEIRLNQEGKWYLDTYLHVGETNTGLTLKAPSKLHPCDTWYWAALIYDGKTMEHYVDGIKEISGEIEFGPMESGLISLGVRLNQVYWFNGKIGEVRFYPKALKIDELQKISN